MSGAGMRLKARRSGGPAGGWVPAMLVGIALAIASPAAAATGPDAVVLVSGLTTTTPFTTPASQCLGTDPRGATWSFDGAQYALAGYGVYTAPVNDGAGPVTPHPPLFSDCPAALPASMTLNSRGDINADARALASFIAYLHSADRVSTVRIVAHSYGGLWTRGALRLASRSFPAVRVLSITTLGTPDLGSYLADIGESVDPVLCGRDVACRIVARLLVAFRERSFEPALSQVTAVSVALLSGLPRRAQRYVSPILSADQVQPPGRSERRRRRGADTRGRPTLHQLPGSGVRPVAHAVRPHRRLGRS